MIEIEIKLRVDPDGVRSLRSWLRQRAARSERLRAIYFDTPARDLAQAGHALRLRHEQGRWVQTLKAPGADALTRFEDEVIVQRGRADSPPVIDPLRHPEAPLLQRLGERAHDDPSARLQPLFETDIRRTALPWRSRRGWVELALDCGHIAAPGRDTIAVSELEIELIRGSPLAVVEVARRIVREHGAWIDPASKAERGHRLASELASAPPLRARAVRIDPRGDVGQALAAMVADCRRQILGNLACIAAGDAHAAEHVHQARVGLRRLRSALRLAGLPRLRALDAPARELAASLGRARDRDVQLEAIVPALAAVGAPWIESPDGAAPNDVRRDARGPASQMFLLDLIAAEMELSSPTAGARPVPDRPAAADEPPDRADLALVATLSRWRRQIRRAANDFVALDDEGRHRLRRRMKRLRYGLEFCASLCPRKRHRRCLVALERAQEALGRYNDLVEAIARYREQAEAPSGDPRAWFAVGWLRSEADSQATRCAEALAAFRAAPAPFRRRLATPDASRTASLPERPG